MTLSRVRVRVFVALGIRSVYSMQRTQLHGRETRDVV